MRIEWTPAARASARRLMADQSAMSQIAAAVSALANDPNPPEAFIRGAYRRLKVGSYRVVYVLEGDVITIERVDQAL
ncbi:MAG TPA: type II toxin-antitoxin system RelE/ParE family toxin [Streptosporangiaceae bacterium]|nr:type II toxin-antitoxin system RelE/ParE family toxin [Streptosporangiaceae bacterium]